ncbi:MAG TPA: 3'-5' exoribonuclease [Devosiaceae bacterium]|jgi:DNA polymerase III epsilon subunit-like protein
MTEEQPQTTFVVTDIETDGHSPLRNSMLSFASVAMDYDGTVLGEFEANLTPRPDRHQDPRTMAWWETQPEAWVAATTDPQPPEKVMARYADWVEGLPGFRVFAAAPIMFDGPWMDHYLDHYAQTRCLGGPYAGRQIFRGGGVCLYTMAGTLRGAPYLQWGMQRAPAEWYGHIEHTHKAIDDARGFANVLVHLFKMTAQLPRIDATESMYK